MATQSGQVSSQLRRPPEASAGVSSQAFGVLHMGEGQTRYGSLPLSEELWLTLVHKRL